jgi:hypothetical protein
MLKSEVKKDLLERDVFVFFDFFAKKKKKKKHISLRRSLSWRENALTFNKIYLCPTTYE